MPSAKMPSRRAQSRIATFMSLAGNSIPKLSHNSWLIFMATFADLCKSRKIGKYSVWDQSNVRVKLYDL